MVMIAVGKSCLIKLSPIILFIKQDSSADKGTSEN